MSEKLDIEQRLEAMEIGIAHQDNTIEELSDVVVKQWAEISRLNDELKFLKSKIEVLEQGRESPSLEDEKPPHY